MTPLEIGLILAIIGILIAWAGTSVSLMDDKRYFEGRLADAEHEKKHYYNQYIVLKQKQDQYIVLKQKQDIIDESEEETRTMEAKRNTYNVKHYLPNGEVNEYIVNQALLDDGRVVIYPEKDKRIYLYGSMEVERI